MIDCNQGAIRAADNSSCISEPLECLRRGNFVVDVTMYLDETRSVFLIIDHMIIQNLVVHGLTASFDARG